MAAAKGNNYSGNTLQARQALEHALLLDANATPDTTKASKFTSLVTIWARQIVLAKLGNVQSATMIIDRMDGKPKIQAEISGPEGGSIKHAVTFQFIPVSAKPGKGRVGPPTEGIEKLIP